MNVIRFQIALGATLLFLCSCATVDSTHQKIPAAMSMRKEAGRGEWLILELNWGNGNHGDFVMDTGSPWTFFDKSLEPQLGRRLDSGELWDFGRKQEMGRYVAPTLYLGRTPLTMTGTNVGTFDCKPLSEAAHRPILGILGMDVLEHYCIQLDFIARKIRFIDGEHVDKKNWGAPFPLTDVGDGCVSIPENLVGVKGTASLIDTGFDYDGWLPPKLFLQWTNRAELATNGEVCFPNAVLGVEKYQDVHLDSLDAKAVSNSDSHTQIPGIGLHFLSRHLVTFDFPNRTLYLKRTSVGPLLPEKIKATMNAAVKSCLKFVKNLKKKNQLPGWSKGDELASKKVDYHFIYPNSLIFDFQKKEDSSFYIYEFTRRSEAAPWKLEKARRTDKNHRTIEEYSVATVRE